MRINLQIGNELASLPNVHCFRFRGVEHNGDLIDCIVKQCDDEIHRIFIESTGESAYNLIRGWMQHLPKKLDSEGWLYESVSGAGYITNFVCGERPTDIRFLNIREAFSLRK